MAIIGGSVLTLVDWASRLAPDGSIDKIVEALSQDNAIIDDMTWIEGNLPTGHQSTIRTGLPSAAWRLLNYGVPQSKGTTVQVTDTVGMLEAYSQVDRDLLLLNGMSEEFRQSEDLAFVDGMRQQFASTVFYGNTSTDPERFLGFAPRFNLSTAINGQNLIKGGGSGADNTSVWLIGWSPDTVTGIFPNGSKAGLQSRDLGEDTYLDGNGLQHQIFRTHFQWKCGLCVRDWRYIVRICNVDVSDLTKNAASGADLVDLMVQALELIYSLDGVNPVFYANRRITSFLRRQLTNHSNAFLSTDELAGKKVMTFGEVPVRRVDAITNAEATVA